MSPIVVFAILMSKIKGLASGIRNITIGSNNQSLDFETNTGATINVNIPNPVNNPSLVNKITQDVNNNLLFDGREIVMQEEVVDSSDPTDTDIDNFFGGITI